MLRCDSNDREKKTETERLLIRFWVLGSTLTTWADCGLIWIPNKQRPWDSPWQGCQQGGPRPLHILRNRDVLSPNTTDTSDTRERLLHQMKIQPITQLSLQYGGWDPWALAGWRSRSSYAQLLEDLDSLLGLATGLVLPRSWVLGQPGIWKRATITNPHNWELITRRCKSSKGGWDSWETDDRRERSTRKLHVLKIHISWNALLNKIHFMAVVGTHCAIGHPETDDRMERSARKYTFEGNTKDQWWRGHFQQPGKQERSGRYCAFMKNTTWKKKHFGKIHLKNTLEKIHLKGLVGPLWTAWEAAVRGRGVQLHWTHWRMPSAVYDSLC